MNLDINDYPGSKNGNGVYQWIINHIPWYEYYVELFGGGAAIAQRIAPLVPDGKHRVYEKSYPVFKQYNFDSYRLGCYNNCGIDQLKFRLTQMPAGHKDAKTFFVYADPPYTKSSRRDPRNLYEHE